MVDPVAYHVGGYAIEFENRDRLRATSTPAELLFQGDLPDRVDPRKSALWSQDWLRIENQGQIGSCQGNALTECLEYCYPVATNGLVKQFSRMYAYIRSQQFSNIKGDSGSTLEGGSKAALDGICTEATAPYPSGYPGWSYITQPMRDEAQFYRLESHTEITSADHLKQFIGSGIGIVQIGIMWGNEMTPDSNGCIRSFSGRGGGGHSVVFCGYVHEDDIKQKSNAGWWGLLKNSWGTRWGVGGFAYVDPRAIDSMIRHQWSSFYGRSEMKTPSPRPLPVDFTKESLLS